MLPFPSSTAQYPVAVNQVNAVWQVTVGPTMYTFGSDETVARAFATAATSTPALVEWYTRAKNILRQLEGLLAEAGLLRVLYEDNKLYDLMLATPANAPLPGVGLPLARLLGMGCLFQDLTAFLAENVVGVPPAPIPLGNRRVVVTLRD